MVWVCLSLRTSACYLPTHPTSSFDCTPYHAVWVQSHSSPWHSQCALHVGFVSILCDEKFWSSFSNEGLPLLVSFCFVLLLYLLSLSQVWVLDFVSHKFIRFSEIKRKHKYLIFFCTNSICANIEAIKLYSNDQAVCSMYGFKTRLIFPSWWNLEKSSLCWFSWRDKMFILIISIPLDGGKSEP